MNNVTEITENLITAAESSSIDSLVNRFNKSYQCAVIQILEMSYCSYMAKNSGKSTYALFSERVIMKGDSMMSKLVKIGEKYDLFFKHKEILPSQWTTLYNLTRLDTEDFIAKCSSGEINASISGAESLKLIGKEPSKKREDKEAEPNDDDNVIENLSGLGTYIYCDSPEKAGALKELIEIALKLGLKSRLSPDYELYSEENQTKEAA